MESIGVRIPHDVSVIGHDDLWICEQVEPRLTSIRRDEDELVTIAVDLLLAQLEGKVASPREVLVLGELVWRDSDAQCTAP